MITAPFNFVPLSEKVFYPPWADDVSHDMPFEDGESGSIDITITVKSPIFVRDHEKPEEFCQHNGEYYIPSTSVKGMVRNVLEIMSFSKMSLLDDKTYSIRDIKYDSYMKKSENVQCGWLFYDNDGRLKIEDCGEPHRIKYDEIEEKFKTFKKSFFMDGTFQNANSPYKKAYEKYNLIDEDILNTTYHFSSFVTDGPGRKVVRFEEKGPNIGNLVLTGHPSARKEPENGEASGKIYDFVFIQQQNQTIYDIDKKVFDNFKFAYFDSRKTQPKESSDWTFWKQKLKDGGKVPVFFHKNLSNVSSFGLSYLYKFPYSKSIMKGLLENHNSDDIDLAEAIFGFSKKIYGKQTSLKGRVQFSHAKKICNTKSLKPRYVLLGTPKASYYPIYLVQNGKEYKTLMDSNSVLAGWKRYPIHKEFKHKCQGDSTQTTLITPLKDGAKFDFRVRFHNLKKAEIGALLSALTFHNHKDTYFHSLGMAKSYGYGKVSFEIKCLNNLQHNQIEYIKAFESAINSDIFNGDTQWHQSEQIKNLFSMAYPQNDNNLEYMVLKDFAKEKKKNTDGSYNYLDRYINLDGVTTRVPSSCSDVNSIDQYREDTKEMKEKWLKNKEDKHREQERAKELQKQKQKEQKDWQKVKDSDNAQAYQSFIEKYPECEKLDDIKTKLEELKKSKEPSDRFATVDANAKAAYEVLQKKKGNLKQYTKEKDKFIKKWSADKNNKKSPFILDLVEKLNS